MDIFGFGFTTLPTVPMSKGGTRKKEATFMGTAGMGDMILLCPAAVYALQYYETVYFPSKEKQYTSVRDFFRNHEDRIRIYLLTNKVDINGREMLRYDPKDFRGDLFGCGCSPESIIDLPISFAENDYHQLGIPYSVRWEYDPIPEASKAYDSEDQIVDNEYTFVHHDTKRGYVIKDKYLDGECVYPSEDESLSILSYAPLIKHAKRIKVIDSCFLHLCESLPTRPDAELEYHKYAKPIEDRLNGVDVPSRKKWKVIYE